MRKADLTGKRFGKLTVVEEAGRNKNKSVVWKCVCDCGRISFATSGTLQSGHSKSCGCNIRKATGKRNYKHGGTGTTLYAKWAAMIKRTKSPSASNYIHYGARGIKVCDEWQKYDAFQRWAQKSGYKDGLTIDRIDVNGDYTPDNCRWVDMYVQANNKRNSKYIVIGNERKTVAEWSRISGINYQTLMTRVKAGDKEDLILRPVRRRQKKAG